MVRALPPQPASGRTMQRWRAILIGFMVDTLTSLQGEQAAGKRVSGLIVGTVI